MPGASTLDEEQLDVLSLGELDARRGEHLLRRLEVQMFGVDEHAVVVEEDRLDHYFLTTYQLFWMSWASSCFSTVRKPARARYSRVFSSPHIAPSPSPPWASETVMQCRHETV